MKAVLKFRADLGRDLVTPQGGIMKINYAKMYETLAKKAEGTFGLRRLSDIASLA